MTLIIKITDSQVQCKQCGALFGKQRLLNAHMHLVHPECCTLSEEERALQEYPFPCHLCSKRFKMRGSLMVHVRFVHGGARLARGAKRSINSQQFDSIQVLVFFLCINKNMIVYKKKKKK